MATKTNIKKAKSRKKSNSKLVFTLLFVSYLGVSTYLLFASGEHLPKYRKLGFLSQVAAYLQVEPDKIMHTLLFVPIIPLAWAAIKPRSFLAKMAVLWSGLLFGAVTELVQHYLPYRTGDIGDWAADIVGSLLGIPFLIFFYKKGKK